MKLTPWKIASSLLLVFALATGGLYYAMENLNAGPKLGGDFMLEGKSGPLGLKNFRGRGVILYFGYTRCPDVCPVSLSKLTAAMKSFSEADRAKITPLFVSVDYRSDTPSVADDYAKFFLKEAVGATGTKAQIDEAVKLYGTMVSFDENKGSAFGYTVQHGDRFYFINGRGKLVSTLPTTSPMNDITQAIQTLL